MQSQIYWMLPIVIGFAKTKNIDEIILEKNYKRKENYKINISFTNKFFYLSKIYFWPFFIKNIFLFFYIFLFLDYKCQNKKYNNIFHSILDYARLISNDKDINLGIINLIKAVFYCCYKYTQAYVLKKKGASIFFLGHSVYGSRAQLAYFREHNLQVFCQASFVVFDNSYEFDHSWNTPDRYFFQKIMNTVIPDEVEKFWLDRKKGISEYIDASDAFRGKKFNEYKKFNLIMLHIFRDSPFSVIDHKRIFVDYHKWIIETLKIISKSNENWILRIHPSGKRWGEDSNLILQNIIQKNNLILGDNILIDKNQFSNLDLLSKAKKIVTYSGTSHLEAACFGKKVIVISEVMLSKYFENLVFKPISINEYSNLLLSNGSSNKFILNSDQVMCAKNLLYIREKLLTLKDDLNGIKIYRNDEKSLYDKEEELARLKSIEIQDELFYIGSLLASNLPQTTKINLMKKLIN